MKKDELNVEAEVLLEESVQTTFSLDDVIDNADKRRDMERPFYGVYTTVLFFDEEHQMFCIQHPFEQEYAIPVSKTTVSISKNDSGSEVLVSFAGGELLYPIVTGKIRDLAVAGEMDMTQPSQPGFSVDGQDKLVFKADKEIVLQCGKSSITLTKAGKVLIRGAYLLSRSSGVNKIKGGSVQLNWIDLSNVGRMVIRRDFVVKVDTQ